MTLQDLQTELGIWADKTFGEGKPIPTAKHLIKEAKELVEALENFERCQSLEEEWNYASTNMKICDEFADCFLLILDCARRYGVNTELLIKLSVAKLAICKTRKWGEPDQDGVVEHIKD